MSVERYLISGEGVVKNYLRLSVARGLENPSSGFNGYLTNQRVIFVKKNKIHEISLDTINSMGWEKRRRLDKWVLYLGIILLLVTIGIILISEEFSILISYVFRRIFDF